jgi:hypothetical protein
MSNSSNSKKENVKKLGRKLGTLRVPKRRKKHLCLKIFGAGCIFFILLIILLLAAIGIIKIPIISSLVYHEPKPKQIITPTEEKAQSLQNKLENPIITEEGFKIEITQEELTSYLVYYPPKNKNEIENPQVVITPKEVELFGKIKEPINTVVKVIFIPWIQNGKLKINIQKIYCGSVRAPSFLINKLQESLSEQLEKSLPREDFYITNIQLKDGKMIISGERQ